MRHIYSIIKADYLQRTRSYAFLVTVAIALFMGYSFIPPPDAHYSTLNAAPYRGALNSAWIGYLSALMTSVMLSLYGIFLVNGGIKKDMDTGVGLIIATTPITNFGYLLSKALSNFIVLITIAGCTFLMSIVMFFLRSSGYPFILSDFVLPYLLFAFPAMFVISAVSVTAEVFLSRYTIAQYFLFFIFFSVIMSTAATMQSNASGILLDAFGVRTMTSSIKTQINVQFHAHINNVSFGYIFGHHKDVKTFVWEGVTWSGLFLFSRVLWIGLALGAIYLSSCFFHRFDFDERSTKKRKTVLPSEQPQAIPIVSSGLNPALLPPIAIDYSILPFIKTEFLLLIRKGSKWLWLVNCALWISLIFAPLTVACTLLLPILYFLQVTRWSELATKEKTNRLHYFTFASYKPLQRMLPAQLLAGVLLAVILALPVMLRLIIGPDTYDVINIISGSFFIVLLALCLGILSGAKKLFEILFFLLTYAIIEKVPIANYLGVSEPHNQSGYILIIWTLNIILGVISFSVRDYQSKNL